MYITNTNAENFHSGGNSGAAGAVAISHASVIFNYGATEILLWTGAIIAARSLVADDPITLPAGALDINFPAGSGGVHDAAIKAAWDALITANGNPTMLLGTGAMGAAGKSNEVADANYARQVTELTTGAGAAPS